MEGSMDAEFGVGRVEVVRNVGRKKGLKRSFEPMLVPPVVPQAVLALPRPVITNPRLRFLFQKQLHLSDVNSFKRIVIPKKAAEKYLPRLEGKDGFIITMGDLNGKNVWHIRFRYWPNDKSRMYVFENIGDFVRVNDLKQGDFIIVCQDVVNHNYVIGAKKVWRSINGVEEKHAMNRYESVYMNFPMEFYDEFPNFGNENNMENSGYVFESTITCDNTEIFDFYNGPSTYYKPKTYPFGSFESLEGLLLNYFTNHNE